MFDIVISFPYSVVLSNEELMMIPQTKKVKIFSLLELLKILKIIKISMNFYSGNKLYFMLQSTFEHIERVRRIFLLTAFLLLLCHLFACIWVFVQASEQNQGWLRDYTD